MMPKQRPDWFLEGRREAGMGWYTPKAPNWLLAVTPIIEGLSEGTQRGIQAGVYGKLSGGGFATRPTQPTRGETGGATLSDVLGSRPATGAYSPPAAVGTGPPTETPAVLGSQSYEVPGWLQWYWQQLFSPPQTDAERLRRYQMARQLGQLGGGPAIRSSRTFKRDIVGADERRSLGEVMRTPVYRYRYADEPAGTQGRLGPMAEEVPARWQTPDGHGIKMPVMVGALMAATRALGRDVQTLKERLRHG
jgi:hypothetical protein